MKALKYGNYNKPSESSVSRSILMFIERSHHATRRPCKRLSRVRCAKKNDGDGFARPLGLVHQVSDWCSGAAAYFGWVREAKRKNTRCGL
jgi:hypothetical protein